MINLYNKYNISLSRLVLISVTGIVKVTIYLRFWLMEEVVFILCHAFKHIDSEFNLDMTSITNTFSVQIHQCQVTNTRVKNKKFRTNFNVADLFIKTNDMMPRSLYSIAESLLLLFSFYMTLIKDDASNIFMFSKDFWIFALII